MGVAISQNSTELKDEEYEIHDYYPDIVDAGYTIYKTQYSNIIMDNGKLIATCLSYEDDTKCEDLCLIMDNNIEELVQFVKDINIGNFEYYLHIFSGKVAGRLFPFDVYGECDEGDYIMTVTNDKNNANIKPFYVSSELAASKKIDYPYCWIGDIDELKEATFDENMKVIYINGDINEKIFQAIDDINANDINDELKSSTCPVDILRGLNNIVTDTINSTTSGASISSTVNANTNAHLLNCIKLLPENCTINTICINGRMYDIDKLKNDADYTGTYILDYELARMYSVFH